MAPLGAVRQDAAILLHDRGASADEARDHLARWGLQSPRRADKTVSFLTDPLWRAYMSTYVEGERLLSRWLDARPDRMPVGGRFVRLLDEQLTPAALADELGRLTFTRRRAACRRVSAAARRRRPSVVAAAAPAGR